MLSSTKCIVGKCKGNFEDLTTGKYILEEAEPQDSQVASLMSGVNDVVLQLHSSGAPGADEIHPKFLKALDVVGLSPDTPEKRSAQERWRECKFTVEAGGF